jgi:hypothetical protein
MNGKESGNKNDIEVKFSGYTGIGNASFDMEKADEELTIFLLKKAGFKEDMIEALLREDESAIYSLVNDPDLTAKLSKVDNQLGHIEIALDKSSNLKNGDKVHLSLTKSDKEIPVKEFKKEFTVSGLKKTTTTTIADILKENKVTFKGFNGFGESLTKDLEADEQEIFEGFKNDGSLKNGDKVTLTITENYVQELESDGILLEGEKNTTVEVSGLKEFKDISNLSEVANLADDTAKSDHKEENYEFLDKKIKYKVARVSTYLGKGNQPLLTTDVDEDAEFYLNVVDIYKVDKTEVDGDKETTETKYELYGYDNVPYVNENIYTDDLSFSQYSL